MCGGAASLLRRCAAALVSLGILWLPASAGAEPLRTLETPLRLVPMGPVETKVAGLHSFFGPLEINSASDGLVVVNRLPLERYLLGLNEVPPEWPEAALQAQAIAARTYALWTLRQPPAGSAGAYGFDICASTDCQVFTGADLLEEPDGPRWSEAVAATRGEVITYGGEPILARYHSVSGGHTLDNAEAYPGEDGFPYLKGVPSPSEDASPLDRWRVTFPLDDLRSLLSEAGWWNTSELTEVYTIDSGSKLHYPDVVFDGPAERTVRDAQEVREVLGSLAARRFPARYPSFAMVSSGRLPETFPSNRFEISTESGSVRVDGRGWGHGVGMSQWGAHGLALEGKGAEEILEHYYTGVRVSTRPGPRMLEVGVATGLESVQATGAFRIEDGNGRLVVPRAVGRWAISFESSGVASLSPPPGFGRPLHLNLVSSPRTLRTGADGAFVLRLSAPAEVRASSGEADTFVASTGRSRFTWRAPDEPGRYRVEVEAVGSRGRETKVVEVEVVSAQSPSPLPAPGGSQGVALVGVALGLALMIIGGQALIKEVKR
ncbi:MAG: SpoIID/LytB domain-containing protein [Actinomycetota bacterium]|nr:SpoIID/LytB domain-containing protein [Actinomycetota bacterium]